MLKRHLFLLSLGILVALTSCSRNRANPPEAAIDRTRPLATILIPPVPVPDAMFTDNRSPPVIGWLWVALANTILDKDKSATFDARHAGFRAAAKINLTLDPSRTYLNSPFDPVPNIVGLNGNPITMLASLIASPLLFFGPRYSPHTMPYGPAAPAFFQPEGSRP